LQHADEDESAKGLAAVSALSRPAFVGVEPP
jgi:hypothetical protein